jgi:uncharacterized protein
MKVREVTTKKKFIIRLDKGELVHDSLQAFCEKEGFKSGWFTALGAINKIELGYYNLETKEYVWKNYMQDHEVVTMVGNVTVVEGKPFLHIHTTVSDSNNSVYGGHLKVAVVAVTLEVHLTIFNEAIERKLDENIGLKLCEL